MNILYFGAESANWVINLCNRFCEQGHTVTCVIQTVDEYDGENPIPLHENLTRIDVGFKEFFNPTLMKSKLMMTMANSKFDIAFGSHAPISPVVADIAKTYRLPWGIMLLDIPTDLMRENRNRMRQWLYWFEVLKYADVMIFNTYVARDEYEKFTGQYFSDEYVIPYAINMPKEYDNTGIDIKGDYVVSICRLSEIKNCLEIPVALSRLEKKPKYVAVGRDNGQLEKIRRWCKQSNIEFKHYEMVSEEEKFKLIKNSALLVYPQRSEYIGGLSPFEGMYCGKPVITRDYKVLKDLYHVNVTYYNNVDDLAKEINYVMNREKIRLKPELEAANAYSKSFASFSNMGHKILNVIKKVVR